ncbi:MAG TPA: 1,2-phenylacetyl-CoA epoxidase subunit PaaD [Chitinophagaceae bacterium]|nr:1,2-phenylacetyl-CoA epoxidase subunit PaaD [Chitinophagaceae bacterium]
MVTNMNQATKTVEEVLAGVMDPEIPVLSITDLGIVREIREHTDELEVVITPTYSGCPAMEVIATNIRMELLAHGFEKVRVTQALSPAWTTDWMTDEGKLRLKEYGIAPPGARAQVCDHGLFGREEAIPCPRCDSYRTRLVSRFSSTACKALYACNDCGEPFDYFKCH